MGKVVKLEPALNGGGTPASKARARRVAARGVGRPGSVDRRRRPRRDKTALVLGGGGFTGGVYEIGALRALDLLAVNSSVNQFDVYVGTSAGSFIAALCANGVTPEEMMRVVTRQGKLPFKDIDIGDLLRLNVTEFARKGALMPWRALMLARQMVTQRGAVSLMDAVMGLAEGLPSGAYTGAGIESYLSKVLNEPGRTDDFHELACELYLTATDLDTCERVVFGVDPSEDVPISTAVRASGALPMVYAPVKVGERELIDGGIVSTTNLDIAIEAGAKFVVVINPIVPFVNDFSESVRTLRGTRPRRVSDMGFPQIGYQAFKLVAHQRLHELKKGWEARYPGVDIVLIEPEPTDELMFQTSMMSFASRVEIGRHGFQSVTKHLAGEYEHYAAVAKRHGIAISEKRLRKVVQHFDAGAEEVSAWRKILEGTTGALLRQAGSAS
ncbi:MAG TPA: patatin-like phospholipase family protein [Solirubrobacteraceae bacterium]|jgi:predicted acylesterase/phospholipase RssA|nr:patatin-like phospholipase family protein [Solirubrobacteraceae bacterium]